MRVRIDADLIERGQPKRVFHCPLAMALERLTGKEWLILGYCAWDGANRYYLPKTVWEWIRAYDRGEAVEPITFDLGDPDGEIDL